MACCKRITVGNQFLYLYNCIWVSLTSSRQLSIIRYVRVRMRNRKDTLVRVNVHKTVLLSLVRCSFNCRDCAHLALFFGIHFALFALSALWPFEFIEHFLGDFCILFVVFIAWRFWSWSLFSLHSAHLAHIPVFYVSFRIFLVLCSIWLVYQKWQIMLRIHEHKISMQISKWKVCSEFRTLCCPLLRVCPLLRW